MIHPVYVDGPLAGQDFPVDEGCRTVQAGVPLSFAQMISGRDPAFEMVTYNVRQFGFASGGEVALFWVASTVWPPGEPAASVLAEHLFTAAARVSMTIEPRGE